MEDLNTRYAKIEEGFLGTGSESGWGTRRKPSFRHSFRSTRYNSNRSPTPSPDPCEDVRGGNDKISRYDNKSVVF